MKAIAVTPLLALSLTCCKFYTSLLGYPKTAKPEQFHYYEANFKNNNSAELARSSLQLQGFYVNHDTVSFTYNAYEGKKVIAKRGTFYRYFKFFDDGSVVHASVITKPDSATNRWLARKPWFITGRFRLQGDIAYVEEKNELAGNKSYFDKIVIHKDSLLVLATSSKRKRNYLVYQYQLR